MARGMRKSLVGKRFGELTVKEYAGTDKFRNSLWKCECDCGRIIIEKGSLLTKGIERLGKVVSCGICSEKYSKAPIEDDTEYIDTSLVGQRFGRLVVDEVFMKTVNKKTGKMQMYAKCTCDCGNKTEVLVTNLKNGKTLSCGCLKTEKVKDTKYLLSDDFIGRRFGKLVVKGFDSERHLWECQCDCGNIKYLKKSNLTHNGYRSCGNCYGKKTKNRRSKEELKTNKEVEEENKNENRTI